MAECVALTVSNQCDGACLIPIWGPIYFWQNSADRMPLVCSATFCEVFWVAIQYGLQANTCNKDDGGWSSKYDLMGVKLRTDWAWPAMPSPVIEKNKDADPSHWWSPASRSFIRSSRRSWTRCKLRFKLPSSCFPLRGDLWSPAFCSFTRWKYLPERCYRTVLLKLPKYCRHQIPFRNFLFCYKAQRSAFKHILEHESWLCTCWGYASMCGNCQSFLYQRLMWVLSLSIHPTR
jgi:hypothetical protein